MLCYFYSQNALRQLATYFSGHFFPKVNLHFSIQHNNVHKCWMPIVFQEEKIRILLESLCKFWDLLTQFCGKGL